MAGEFWLDDRQWAVIAPLLPINQPGAHRTDDRRVIGGIIHVLRSGCRWQDCPACYGPPTTIYNRFHRWSAKCIWRRLFEALEQNRPDILIRRQEWFDGQFGLDPARLVFIDEAWASTNMARRDGRCAKGDPLRVSVSTDIGKLQLSSER